MSQKENARLVEIRENEKEIAKVAETAKTILTEEHHITITNAAAIPTIAYAFMKQLVVYLNKNKAAGQDVEINFMQLLDIGISHREGEGEKEGSFTPYTRPGQELKLLVKDDGETEAE